MPGDHTSHSLLERARDPADAASWRRMTDIYIPLIRRAVRPYVAQPADIDDLVQEVLATLIRELPRFEHNGRPGAFRCWLRAIAVNRIRSYWHCRHAPQGAGGDDVIERLHQLEDPDSLLSRAWDEAHDRHVARCLIDLIRLEFQPATWHAFEQTVREDRPAADVAAEMGMTVNAVLIAKSRILKRLREKAGKLLD